MSSFSLFHWFILFVVVFVIYSIIRSGKAHGDTMYCRTCGHRGPAKTVTGGNLAIEIILWLCFIVPGLIYSIWRLSSRHQACKSCGSREVIPIDAPAAVLANKPDAVTSGGDTKLCPFCAETVKKAAVVCKHCGKAIPAPSPDPDPAIRPTR